ncbi:MAG: hypothetical protein ABIN79_09780 [Marmoricola sp.]
MTSYAPFSVVVLAVLGLLVLLSSSVMVARVERRAHAGLPRDTDPSRARSSV